ncbi:MAG: AlkA N-terminal domain-containing protein [Syntrophobacteraceae bacterium]|nr:AlkA N-terminal domain-containing protein [Syntrophobacteraceae bacterium]
MKETKISGPFLDPKACYAAMRAHDARFDGRFFCGVSSTGIYCRPICRVRVPREENCTFFVSAAAAEAAGYRPCLRCRPEPAPGLAPVDAMTRLAGSVAWQVEEGGMGSRSLKDLAARVGISERHLRRVFQAQFGVPPVRYLQTYRLLLAKNLLSDTRLSVTDVAMAAGFGSIRRFNHLFWTRYHLAPSKMRKQIGGSVQNCDAVTLSLSYRPPYAWGSIISFLCARALPGVESVCGGVYRRAVALKKGETVYRGWISVADRPERSGLCVTLATSLLPVLSQVLTRVRVLFDLNCDPEKVREKLAGMDELLPGVYVAGIRAPGCFDPFEISVRAILGQQITVKAATTLSMRLAHLLGDKVDTPFEELRYAFFGPERILALAGPIENHLGPVGINGGKARSIFGLAQALTAGAITLSHGANPEETMDSLGRLRGFGPWTVHYIALRALGWPDAFPHTDFGVRKALAERSCGEILELSKKWSPWRSYATVLLWNFLAKESKDDKKRSSTQ